ncbi:family S53 protease-like protein [Mycena maculata]|uniref:Family S53 protease-like protein n=1 Tax=Mycena maculata TaxID=230809 RepID=A0AAD7NXW7_9AGAR|nr:family S53 protease-like protein [Mycena maculata]
MALRKCLTILHVVTAVYGGMVVHESRSAAPSGFVSQGPAPSNEMLILCVALTSNNLEQKLMSVSTPGNSEFRQWLSMDEVKAFVEPSPETVAVFTSFSSANGLKPTVISPNGDWVSITFPVSQANELFEVFAHPSMTNTITRTLPVSLPSELVGHVEVIHLTTAFVGPNVRGGPVSSNFDTEVVPESCNSTVPTGVITPTCLQDLYLIPKTHATEKGNSLLVTAYEEQFSQRADLAAFLQLLRPDIPPTTTFTLLSVDGGVGPQNLSEAGTEASLDIQYTTGIATEVPIDFLSNGAADFPTSLKVCNGYMALTSRGVSVVWRGHHDTLAVCNDTVFIPVFPAVCPLITAVGSTQGFAPEHAINFPGGGFSNFFPRPSYQDERICAPTFAGIIALINDRLIAARKPVLGFLNPFLYSRASKAFTDITIGHNPGFICPASSVAFDAAVGWDALSRSPTSVNPPLASIDKMQRVSAHRVAAALL